MEFTGKIEIIWLSRDLSGELIVYFVCLKQMERLDIIRLKEFCNFLHSGHEEFIDHVKSTKVFMIFDTDSILCKSG